LTDGGTGGFASCRCDGLATGVGADVALHPVSSATATTRADLTG
jgi:hypothetical protein